MVSETLQAQEHGATADTGRDPCQPRRPGDLSTVTPKGPLGGCMEPTDGQPGQPRAGRPRRFTAAIGRFWAVCPPFAGIYFLFIIFMASAIFQCHQHLALLLSPWASPAHVVLVPGHLPGGGMWTVNVQGHLGNQMGEYATLYALAKLNGRLASILAWMHSTLAPIFRITLPVLHSTTASQILWRNYHLNDWVEEEYCHIPGEYVRLTGYPCSWTFYHHLCPEILQEFTLHDHVREEAQAFLQELRVNGSRPGIFVGIHVRRGDYVHVMLQVLGGVVADRGYLQEALGWFRARHCSLVFVVSSDNMAWCRWNIDASRGDVAFTSNGLQGSPVRDLALLTQCNHTVMTIGTFGFWAAYLAGGDTVYLANFTRPGSHFRKVFRPQAAFLPEWVGIAANLGPA